MKDPYNKLARMLRTQATTLLALEQKMNALTGQEGVFEDILRENEVIVDRTLSGLGLSRTADAATVHEALMDRLRHLDRHLYDLLDQPDLQQMNKACTTLCETALKVFTPPQGLFLKRGTAKRMLAAYPPHNVLEHFGYRSVEELFEKEGFAQVMASLRFTQTTEWMHQFFDIAYSNLGPDDFEERDVEMIILDKKWLAVAEKFLQKKYHNVSHLKEFGVIFIVPIPLDAPGDTLRMFTLMLHYLHEVPFYAGLFRRHLAEGEDFPHKFKSLLRGDVSAKPAPDHGRVSWRIVQRYLAKDNPNDFRLFEPHVNPEADHWWRAEEDLGRLSRILRPADEHKGQLDLGWWSGLDFVGELFRVDGTDELVSFDLIDLIMSLVDKEQRLYHHQEALWNKIFVEYLGRERMNRLVAEHLVEGFIILE